MDLAKLSAIAMKEEPLFRRIVSTKIYNAYFESSWDKSNESPRERIRKQRQREFDKNTLIS